MKKMKNREFFVLPASNKTSREKKIKRKKRKTATPDPAAAGAASGSSGGGGAAPVVAPAAPLSGGKKALLGSALRELTSVLGGPGGASPAGGGGGKINRVVGSILSLALENNANGLFAQPQGIFDFGKLFGVFFVERPRSLEAEGGEEKEEEEEKTLETHRDASFLLSFFSLFSLSFLILDRSSKTRML